MTKLLDPSDPLHSLKAGHWFKLICGASFQHLPAVRTLTLAYAIAGADCIDVAADPAVITAAQSGLAAAAKLAPVARQRGFPPYKPPLLMVSLNDGEDPHFRKAEFDPQSCPPDCSRPCQSICPADAIAFRPPHSLGVITEKCYGCGRCLPVCPYDIIYTSSYVSTPGAVAPLVLSGEVSAVEIHTQVGRYTEFQRLWTAIEKYARRLKVVAVSCPDGEGIIEYLTFISKMILPQVGTLVWQTDGRAMSGDIGDGTTQATVKFGQKVLAANLPGYVQLAGGTNGYTVAKLRSLSLLKHNSGQSSYIAGIAYGSYARKLLSPVIHALEEREVNQTGIRKSIYLEQEPDLLWQAVELASSLVSQLKSQSQPTRISRQLP